ncbi:unnamed protein product [Aphanomyces euteiches]
MVAVYSVETIVVVTGVAPFTGAVTPVINGVEITAGAVAGNMAVIIPEFASLVAGDAVPATVKKSSATPASVNPALATSVMVAVYPTDPANFTAVGDQTIVPVYSSVAITDADGVAPTSGTITPSITGLARAAGAVAGKTAVITPESASLDAGDTVPATVKKSSSTPVKV